MNEHTDRPIPPPRHGAPPEQREPAAEPPTPEPIKPAAPKPPAPPMPKAKSCKTVLWVILAIIITALMVSAGTYYWLTLDQDIDNTPILEERIQGLETQLDQCQEQASEQAAAQPETPGESSQWLTYLDSEKGFLFQYPQGYHVAQEGAYLLIYPNPTLEDEAPLAVMAIRPYDGMRDFEALIGENVSPLEADDVVINGISGKEYLVTYPTYAYGNRCPIWFLGTENMTFDFRPYECADWEYFEEVINKFYLMYK